MDEGGAEAFDGILREYLLSVVVDRGRREHPGTDTRYALVGASARSRLKCPCCMKYVLTAKYTQHLSKCIKRDH
jgi:hypothetical protein